MIEGGEYKYIFPVFAYDKKTGKVLRLLHAALTNNPMFDCTLDRLSMGGLRGELRLLGGCPRIAIVARAKLAELDFSII